MKYPLITVPKELDKPFFEMNKKDAQAYLDWFLSIKKERLGVLNEAIIKDNNKDWMFNFEPDSLIPLFIWFKAVITVRDKTREEIEAEQTEIKGLLKDHIDVGDKTFTPKTVTICSDVGMYFGEVLMRKKDLEWSFILKPKRSVEYAQPILTKQGAKIDLNPRRIIENVAREVIDESFEENELIKLYKIWEGYF